MSDLKKGMLFSAAGACAWGISGVCGQFLFTHYDTDPSWLTAVRMVCSGLVLLVLAFVREKGRVVKILRSPRDCAWLTVFGVAGLLLCQYTYLAAIRYSNSGTASVLQSLNVVMMTVVMAVRHRRGIGLRQGAAVALAMAGTWLITTNGNPAAMVLSPAGLVLGLVSAAGVVLYTLLSRGLIARWSNTIVTGWGMLIGGVVFSLAIRVWTVPVRLDALGLLIVAVIILVGTAGGFTLFLEGIRFIGPEKGTLVGCLEPVAATVLSALCLHTSFGLMELLGFVCIMATVFLSARQETRRPA